MRKALLLIALAFAGASVARGQGDRYHCDGEVYTGPGRGGAPGRKLSEQRESDSHRNVVKVTHYRADPATGEMAPFAVSYSEITYF